MSSRIGGKIEGRKEVAPVEVEVLLSDVRELILSVRSQVAQTVNAGLTLLYWRVGKRIHHEVLRGQRAEYGSRFIPTLSYNLVSEFGNSFAEKNLRRMVQLAEIFPDEQIVVSLVRHLSWTHFIALLPLKSALQREFYAEMCRTERWSVRVLRKKIDSMLYERTALSKKPEHLIEGELKALREEDRLTPDMVFRDPYVLDFLGLKDTYSEQDLENALIREVESFLLELGAGFAFVERQKRITLDGDDYYMDLLFFHRRLRRLVCIELKIGDFKPADVGQIELYLRWLERHERQEGEEKPMGIILCAGKGRETIEILELEPRGIHVGEYLTELPPRELLQNRLREALKRARMSVANGELSPRAEAGGEEQGGCR